MGKQRKKNISKRNRKVTKKGRIKRRSSKKSRGTKRRSSSKSKVIRRKRRMRGGASGATTQHGSELDEITQDFNTVIEYINKLQKNCISYINKLKYKEDIQGQLSVAAEPSSIRNLTLTASSGAAAGPRAAGVAVGPRAELLNSGARQRPPH